MDWFKLAYTVLGGLGIFFFGMKMMSDSLQVVADNLVRRIINSLTKNRLVAVLVGLTITSIVQSSSIVTVMVVGFVNAGLMNLFQAIGVVFGANIGTTITGWIIAIKVGKYSLLFIGLGMIPMLFARSGKWAGIGRVVFSLGLVFLGLSTMSGAFKPLRGDEAFISFMTLFAADSYFSLLATVAMGCILTFVIQSSSAMLGITMALGLSGSISFQTAAALVLGENIGTTVTALLACVGANVNAKRAALAHAFFNVLGVGVMTTIFWPYISLIDSLVDGSPDFVNAEGSKPFIGAHIAASHTIFNVANVIIFLPFISMLARLVTKIVPDKKAKEPQHLEFLGDSSLMSPSLAIEQAYQEVKKLAAMVETILGLTKTVVFSDKDEADACEKVVKYEKITDNVQKEVIEFMGKVMEVPISHEQSERVKSILRLTDELESIADDCDKIVRFSRRMRSGGLKMDEQTEKDLRELVEEAIGFYDSVFAVMADETLDRIDYREQSNTFQKKVREVRSRQLDRLAEGKHQPLTNLTIGDILESLRRIRAHTVNLAEAYYGQK